ncbi:MAG: hypothetical protein DRJ98_04800 [Thermoprotei archaeon]|nr:MAG: hypothetical protein DRJ98_04800 [Thermoprotei archaeon]RLF18606.1 MAG: hypothetical protein DRN06_00950 [Thermoprotei archaeon]
MFILVSIALVEALTHFGAMPGDHPQYFNVTKFFLGQEPLITKVRIVRPLVPLLAAPFSLVMPLPYAYGVVNTAFYLLTGVACYALTLKLTKSKLTALYSGVLVLTSFPMIAYGAASSKEGAGLFFQMLAALLALKLAEGKGVVKALAYGLIAGVGMLSMEIVIPAVAFGLLLLSRNRMFKEAAAWLITAVLPSVFVGALFNYSIISWYLQGGIEYASKLGLLSLSAWFNPSLRLRHLVEGLSPFVCLFMVVGLAKLRGEANTVNLFVLMIIPGVAAYFAWPPVTSRQVITMSYAIYWVAARGLASLGKKPWIQVTLLLVNAILCNYLAFKWYSTCFYLETLGPWKGFSVPWPP